MELITAIIRKERLNDILTQPFESDVHGIIVTPVQRHGGEIEKVYTYRGLTVKVGLERTRNGYLRGGGPVVPGQG